MIVQCMIGKSPVRLYQSTSSSLKSGQSRAMFGCFASHAFGKFGEKIASISPSVNMSSTFFAGRIFSMRKPAGRSNSMISGSLVTQVTDSGATP